MKSVICSSSGRPRSLPPARRLGERGARGAMRVCRELLRSVDPELAHVGPLAMTLVAAPRLAERGVRPGHVEDVVDDLKQHAQLGREATKRHCRRFRRPRPTAARSSPTRRSAARLQLVQAPQPRRARGGGLARRPHTGPPTMPFTPSPPRARRPPRARAPARSAGAQQVAEGLRVQAVAGEDGHVLAERHVARRLSPAQRRRRPSRAGRRGSASRCGSARSRRRAAAPRGDPGRPRVRVASASTGRIRLPPASSE